jgi:DNA-binding transcriptional MerR regulator
MLRIGEFARRVGVSPELLRAWERRYGLMRPVRSPGGFRLYADEDVERIARMRRGLEAGLSAAEAARAALGHDPVPEGALAGAATRLLAAVHDFDEPTVHALLDESLAAFALEPMLRELILPTLRQVGLDWDTRPLAIGEEHFASNLIRGRLISLARLWGRGKGPRALLACAPGEEHDISLLAFGLVLRSYGWRILFLGADTPIATVTRTAESTEPDVVVLTAFDPARLEGETTALRRLAKAAPVLLSGPGASDTLSARLRIPRLGGDLIEAAKEVAERA